MAETEKTNAVTNVESKTGWAKIWRNFEEKHPKLAKWLYQIFYFFVFSMGVTIIQYLFFTFMPGILGEELAGTEFMWPQVHMDIFGVEFTWSLLGYNVLYDASGAVMIGGGLGYFISYEVGSFVGTVHQLPAPEEHHVQEPRQSGVSGDVVFHRMDCDFSHLQWIQ